MGYSRIGVLVCALICLGCSQAPAPLQLTQEEQKVVEVATDHLTRRNLKWDTPIEITRPPNRVNAPDWKRHVEEEGNIWKIVYQTPDDELRALGPRTLFVNMRTKAAMPSMRK